MRCTWPSISNPFCHVAVNGFVAGGSALGRGGDVCRLIASMVLFICPFIDLLVNPNFDPHVGETKCDKEPRDADGQDL